MSMFNTVRLIVVVFMAIAVALLLLFAGGSGSPPQLATPTPTGLPVNALYLDECTKMEQVIFTLNINRGKGKINDWLEEHPGALIKETANIGENNVLFTFCMSTRVRGN